MDALGTVGEGKRDEVFQHKWRFIRSGREEQLQQKNYPSKMAKEQEVERIAKTLDKMVHKKNTVS